MGTTTSIWQNLKAPIAIGAANYFDYELIQSARDLNPGSTKDFLNQNLFAGAASTLSMVVNGFFVLDGLTLLIKYWDNPTITSTQKGLIIFSGLLALTTMVYTGLNFFDQRYTGGIGLLTTISALFNSFAQSNIKELDLVKQAEEQAITEEQRSSRGRDSGFRAQSR